MEPQVLTAVGTVLGTALLLVLRDWRDGRSLFKRAEDNVPKWAEELQSHYNHDTTKELQEIKSELRTLTDAVGDANTSLKNMDKYGVKIRA